MTCQSLEIVKDCRLTKYRRQSSAGKSCDAKSVGDKIVNEG